MLRARRRLRLRSFDYASPGAYFVTVCTQGRVGLLGGVIEGSMRPSAAGRMVEDTWCRLPAFYAGIDVDAFVVMPNHLHGVVLVGAPPCGRPAAGRARGPAPTLLSLFDVMHRFKTLTTRTYISGVRQLGWPSFNNRLWQRGYYERVVRDADELMRIRQYIEENPARWLDDAENPLRPVTPQTMPWDT